MSVELEGSLGALVLSIEMIKSSCNEMSFGRVASTELALAGAMSAQIIAVKFQSSWESRASGVSAPWNKPPAKETGALAVVFQGNACFVQLPVAVSSPWLSKAEAQDIKCLLMFQPLQAPPSQRHFARPPCSAV